MIMFHKKSSAVSAFVLKLLFTKFQLVCCCHVLIIIIEPSVLFQSQIFFKIEVTYDNRSDN